MTEKLTRLELTWPGKEDRFNPEPRILLEDKEKSFSFEPTRKSSVQPTYDNMLIHGDNLLALKALEQDYTGKVKCIYIDPPYNTGNAFEHYDDGLEHSIWLSLMRDRLEILKRLLDEDGVIFVQIDSVELHYLKVLMDEIFGRDNFISNITCKVKAPSGVASNAQPFFDCAEYILCYSKSGIFNFKSLKLDSYTIDKTATKVTGAFNQLMEYFDDQNIDYITNMEDVKIFKVKNYKITTIPKEKRTQEFYYQNYDNIFETAAMSGGKDKKVLAEIMRQDEPEACYIYRYVPSKGKNAGKEISSIVYKKRGVIFLKDVSVKNDDKKYIVKQDIITNVITLDLWQGIANEGGVEFKNGKKPERLIELLLSVFTNPGDLVLDSFLGSGTTAAVAHKMGRRWIGVEMGDHVYTHCIPRLQKVIKGEDTGGVTKSTGWTCGGGFKFYELASSLIVKDKYGQQIISKEYNADMLAEAMCKILGYHYKPDAEKYWKQGFSSEKSFIYTTTMSMQEEVLSQLAAEVGDDNLLVCCSAFIGNHRAYPNITVKKIPSAILKKCKWGREGYPLNLSKYTPTDEDFEFEDEEE